MGWTVLLLDFVPLLVFVTIDSFSSARYAVVGAIGAAALAIGYRLYRFGQMDEFSYATVTLILLFGALSFKSNNPVYFKFKPVIINLLMAAAFLGTYAMGKPLLSVLLERYSQAIPSQVLTQLHDPLVQAALQWASLFVGFGLMAQAALVAWAALHLSNWWWLAIRTVGFYVMMTLVVMVSVVMVFR